MFERRIEAKADGSDERVGGTGRTVDRHKGKKFGNARRKKNVLLWLPVGESSTLFFFSDSFKSLFIGNHYVGR